MAGLDSEGRMDREQRQLLWAVPAVLMVAVVAIGLGRLIYYPLVWVFG
jgi:hypothetical protein